jgi:hypothetical protein
LTTRERTIFIAYGLANGDGRFLVGVLHDEDLGQLDAQAVGHEFGEDRVAVAGQQFYGVCCHYDHLNAANGSRSSLRGYPARI